MENETFETALEKLEKIIDELENGTVDLDKSIKKYTEAMELVKFCSDKLSSATKTVNKIMEESGNLKEFKTEDQ